MLGIPISFKLERRSILPILTVTGVSENVPEIESFLLAKSVEIIEKAQQFKGRVMETNCNKNMSDVPKGMIAVRFYIIFKNEAELETGIEGIKRELG